MMDADRLPEPPELAVVMPIFNEQLNLPSVIREWFGCLKTLGMPFVFFAINDGSTDGTAEILTELTKDLGPRLRSITKSNSGHGRSCRQGYELALAEEAHWVFQIDSDGQCDSAFFPQLCAGRENYDCIFGDRRTRITAGCALPAQVCCRWLLRLTTGASLRDPNVPYRLIRAGTLRAALRTIPTDLDLQNIALSVALARDRNVRWRHVPIHVRSRRARKNGMKHRNVVKMGITLLRDLGRIRGSKPNRWQQPAWAGDGVSV